MHTIRFRHAAPLAVLMMLVSMAPFDAGGADETKRPARRQAADGMVGAPKQQAAGVAGGAPKRQAAGRPTGASKAPTALADSAQAAASDSGVTKPDSTLGHAKPARSAARPGADRDSSTRKAPVERDEPKEEPPVRGPRMPIWPGISYANPSAGHEKLAAAW